MTSKKSEKSIETWTDVVDLANELIRDHNLQSKQEQFRNIAREAWEAILEQPDPIEFNIREELEERAVEMNNQIRNDRASAFATAFLREPEISQVLHARATGNWEGIAAASNPRVRTKMLEILDSIKNDIVKEYQLNLEALHKMYMPAGRPTDKELERRMHAVLHALKERLGDVFTKDEVKKALNIIVTADVESHKLRF